MPPASGRASTRFRDPHCWPNWSKRPAPSADPNRNPTAPTPLSPATAESETRNAGAAAAPRTATGEKEKRDLFLQCSTGSSGWDGGEPGWGTWGWDQNRTLSPEIARRRLSGDLLFALAVSDGLLLWSFSVWFLASTWSFSLLFVFFSLITTLLFSQKLRWLVKKKERETDVERERERARAIDKTLVSSIKDFEFNCKVWNFESI